jgi:protein-arginine kinase activator protein McsA
MTTLLEHLPASLIKKMHSWLDLNYGHERTFEMTDAQFYHKVEMHALAPFKQALWDLPAAEKERICKVLESQFDSIFTLLGCSNSYTLVHEHIKPVIIEPEFEGSHASIESNQAANGLAG